MFDEVVVRRALRGTRFRRLAYAYETASTNDDATSLLGDASAAGTLIVAEYQRHGRGRRGRRWLAPPGSALLFTAIMPEPIPAANLWAVPFWCALSVADGVAVKSTVPLVLQWPNDLLLSGHKVCGILGTSRVVSDDAWVGCGVGLNVHRAEAHGQADASAAYLSDAAPSLRREDLLVAIAERMDARFASLSERPHDVAREWERRAGLPGARYRVQVDGEPAPFEGTALRLDGDGSLVLSVEGGERRATMADARVLRD